MGLTCVVVHMGVPGISYLCPTNPPSSVLFLFRTCCAFIIGDRRSLIGDSNGLFIVHIDKIAREMKDAGFDRTAT